MVFYGENDQVVAERVLTRFNCITYIAIERK